MHGRSPDPTARSHESKSPPPQILTVSIAGNAPESKDSAWVEDGGAPRPAQDLLRAAPNPFRGSTTVGLNLTAPGRARLAIYDLTGRLVRVLLDQEATGVRSVVWDGTTADGSKAHPGVYVIRLEAHGQVFAHKMVKLP